MNSRYRPGSDHPSLFWKALQDKFCVGRLKAAVNQGISVYIQQETEIFLLTETGRR
jgi:hypothetical protein